MMFIIIRESGEYSDYNSHVEGYTTTEEKAQEIVNNKNKDLNIIKEWKDRFDESRRQIEETDPFEFKEDFSFDIDSEEMKRYNDWKNDKEKLIENWVTQQNLDEEMLQKIYRFYYDNYKYIKIEEIK